MAYKNPKDPRLKIARLKHNYKNKNYYIQRKNERVKALRQWLLDYKTLKGCNRCPESFPQCLEFHHKDSKIKEKMISECINNGWSIERILKEIQKCEILCTNCHRKEHHK